MTTATATRTYNSDTGKYELPDPWAGAPDGVRIQYAVDSNYPVYGVLATEGCYFGNRDGNWNTAPFPYRDNLQNEINAARRADYEFPDFEGAPIEGIRVYIKFFFGFTAYVVPLDGPENGAVFRNADGVWREGAWLKLPDLRDDSFVGDDVFLVDELPVEEVEPEVVPEPEEEQVVEDRWAGAPKGIRVSTGMYLRVLVGDADNWIRRAEQDRSSRNNNWNQESAYADESLQYMVTMLRREGQTFPDFEGAPVKGTRFFYKTKVSDAISWNPVAVSGKRVVYRHEGSDWRDSTGTFGDDDAEVIEWFRLNYDQIVLVDDEPKPETVEVVGTHGGTPIVVHHDQPTDWPISYFTGQPISPRSQRVLSGVADRFRLDKVVKEEEGSAAFQPGDVIRDLDNGTLWYAHSSPSVTSKVQSYQQIGARNLSAPTIVKAANWQKPKRFAVTSKAVAQ